MTTSETEETGPAPDGTTPTGNFEPNTPPPGGNFEPNTPPPTGNFEPNTPPPGGNFEPNTPPPGGNFEPNTPPPANGTVPSPNGGVVTTPATSNGWIANRVIQNVWSTSAQPGVWALVGGDGWKRLAGSESGRNPLTALALLAKVNGLPVSYHVDAYGQIDQLLV